LELKEVKNDLVGKSLMDSRMSCCLGSWWER